MTSATLTLPEALNLAFAAFNSGKLREAENVCRQILTAKPDVFDALHLLAVAQSRLGNKIDALANYEQALILRPDNFEALSNCGITLHQIGRYKEALACYDRALAVRPRYAEALCNRGNVLRELGRPEEALESYERALAENPEHVDSWSNRGNILRELARYDEAVASYDRALVARPDLPDTLSNRGVALHELGRFDEALASYDEALALRPHTAEALSNRGNTLHELKRYDEALVSYDRALAARPDYADALSNRGNTLRALKRFEEALICYDRALATLPGHPEIAFNRGNALHGLQRFEEAVVSYDRALSTRPDYVEALSNRGTALQELKRYDDALVSYDKALAERPDYARALSNRGNVLRELKRFDEAMANYGQALAIQPDNVDALINRGNLLTERHRFDEALAGYERALELQPDHADGHFNEAICRALLGDLPRCWEKYEYRWETNQGRRDKRDFKQPLWRGSDDIRGETILLHAEQGLGDTIQFCRYASLVAARGARVILEVQEPLQTLLAESGGSIEVIARDDPLPAFDRHCPLLSLPFAFDTSIETIPPTMPYLRVSTERADKWRDRLDPRHRPAIGLVWSGLAAHKNDHNRSMALYTLLPLLECDAHFVSLQKEVRAGDAALLREQASNLLHLGDTLDDLADTAALVANLDLVISVDTSVAHLAGALAKPVWIMLPFAPDWRWLLNRDDSPWYPTARLFRQTEAGEWDDVIVQVKSELLDWSKAMRARNGS